MEYLYNGWQLWNCRVLKSLDVWRAKTLTDVGLKALGTGCQQLEELDAGWWYVGREGVR